MTTEQQPMFEDPPPDLNQQIAELERELAVRQRVYPRWVQLGKIDQAVAEYRINALHWAILTLYTVRRHTPEGT